MDGEPNIIDGKPLKIVNAIELGHIFKLGTKYSEAIGAKILDENGKEKPIVMGSYGIGVERALACIIEQNYDENGLKWSKEFAPFDVHILSLSYEKSDNVRTHSDNLKKNLESDGILVLLDDRKERPGFKFKDADLLGIPLQVTIGDRGLENNEVELKLRNSGEKIKIKYSDIQSEIIKIMRSDESTS
jgi:prolyl-tRNA synthetase